MTLVRRTPPFTLLMLLVLAGLSAHRLLAAPSSSPDTGDSSPSNPFQKFNAADVAKITLCELPDPFDSPLLRPLTAEITEKETIFRLYQFVKTAQLSNRPEYPLAGILSYQVWLDAKGGVLALTSVMVYDSYVVIQEGYLTDAGVSLGSADRQMGFYACFQSSAFCRIVYDLMKRECPDVIERLEKWTHQLGGRSLENALFMKKKQPTSDESGPGSAAQADRETPK